MSADLATPVSIYLRIRDLYPQSALLESSDYHTSQNSVSYIGVQPIGSFKVVDNMVYTSYPDGRNEQHQLSTHCRLTDCLKDYVNSYEFDNPGDSDSLGLFGFTAYDCVRHFEKVDITKREQCFAEFPDMHYNLFRFIIRINHYNSEMTITEILLPGQDSELSNMADVINNNQIAQYPFALRGEPTSTLTDEEYLEMVREGVRHAKLGNVFQIVLSRRFSQSFSGDDFNVYRALRNVNPSPYLFYFDFGNFRIFGSSPETHLRVQGNTAYIDPIAGTYRRTGNDIKDRELAKALLEDSKENAEHVMLVDLARNDLSRSGGTVEIDFLKQIQYYSHVIHMVSRVRAELPSDADVYSLYAGTFPAGTLSGAPKVRAMQIIDELEPHSRLSYGGCIGYIGLNGDLNQAITIRSFLSINNTLYSQAGAGIVAHSVPENELQETNNKLGALVSAVKAGTTFEVV